MSKKKKAIINNNLPSWEIITNYFNTFAASILEEGLMKLTKENINFFNNQIEELIKPTLLITKNFDQTMDTKQTNKNKEKLKDIHINSLQEHKNTQKILLFYENEETYLKDYFLKYEPSNEVKMVYDTFIRLKKVYSYFKGSEYKHQQHFLTFKMGCKELLESIEAKLLDLIDDEIAKYEEETIKTPQKYPKNQQKAFTLYKYIDLFKNPIEVIFEYMNRLGSLFNNKRIKCNAPP